LTRLLGSWASVPFAGAQARRVAGHHPHAARGDRGLDAILAHLEAAGGGAQHAPRGRTVEIAVQHTDATAPTRERRRQPGGHDALSHAVLSAHHGHHVTDRGEARRDPVALRGDLREEVGAVAAVHLVVGADAPPPRLAHRDSKLPRSSGAGQPRRHGQEPAQVAWRHAGRAEQGLARGVQTRGGDGLRYRLRLPLT